MEVVSGSGSVPIAHVEVPQVGLLSPTRSVKGYTSVPNFHFMLSKGKSISYSDKQVI